jgi:LmbE family N-acetylglucosaminyl deacetylase
VPDGAPIDAALKRTTHLAIGAHQDDLEIMAVHGILACYQIPDQWFTGVVVTDGRGAPRSGRYADLSDEDMVIVRRREQYNAACVGDYAAQIMLEFPSSVVKDADSPDVVRALEDLLRATNPRIVYTHNLADKHDTHVATTLRVIQALRNVRATGALQDVQVYGCEVWRDLDWLVDDDKVAFDVSEREGLQSALVGAFDSQVSGGKRYDLASLGRRRAHATYHASHAVDNATGLTFAMDLTELVEDPARDPEAFVRAYLARFQQDVCDRVARFSSRASAQ